jgi:hypothetical protein
MFGYLTRKRFCGSWTHSLAMSGDRQRRVERAQADCHGRRRRGGDQDGIGQTRRRRGSTIDSQHIGSGDSEHIPHIVVTPKLGEVDASIAIGQHPFSGSATGHGVASIDRSGQDCAGECKSKQGTLHDDSPFMGKCDLLGLAFHPFSILLSPPSVKLFLL